MKPPRFGNVIAVLRRELAAYFYSPVAYVIGALFLLATGLSFFALVRALADPAAPAAYGAVLRRFFGGSALYWAFTLNVPAVLTMRLIAEERHKGTLETLLTAPITEARVVLAKFLAAFVFYALLWLPTVVLIVVIARAAPAGTSLDLGPVLSAYLGVFVSGAAFLAIGLLASSLTRHQLLAATGAYVVLLALLLAGTLPDLGALGGEAALSPDRSRLDALLAYLDLRRHMDDFGRGIVDLRWIILYLTIAAGALALATWAVTLRGRGRRPGWTPLSAPLVVLAVVLANLIAARAGVRADWTRSQVHTLSPRSRAIAGELPGPVEVILIEGVPALAEVYADVRELLAGLSAASHGKLTVTRVDPARDPGAVTALAARASSLPTELERGGAVIFLAGTRTHAVGIDDLAELSTDEAGAGFVAALRAEAAFASALLAVGSDQHPRICPVVRHGERSFEPAPGGGADWSALAERLRKTGYDLRPPAELGPETSKNCELIVLAGPRTAPDPAEAVALGQLLDGGGRVLLALDGLAATGLEPLTERRGIRIHPHLVVDPGLPAPTPSRWRTRDGFGNHPAARPFQGRALALFDRPRALEPLAIQGVEAAPLVVSSAEGWGEHDPASLAPGAALGFDPASDLAGPVPIAVAATLTGGGRLLVLGDASAFDTATIAVPGLSNGELGEAWIAWLTDRAPLVDIGPRHPEQLRLVLTSGELRRIFWLSVVVMPLALLAVGLVVFQRRRR